MRYFYKGSEHTVFARTNSVWIIQPKARPDAEKVSVHPMYVDEKPDNYDASEVPLRSDSGEFAGLQFPGQILRQNLEQSLQAASESAVNPNTATQEQLVALPGIGRSRAERILENRPPVGYESFEQLKELNGDMRVNWEALEIFLTFDE